MWMNTSYQPLGVDQLVGRRLRAYGILRGRCSDMDYTTEPGRHKFVGATMNMTCAAAICVCPQW